MFTVSQRSGSIHAKWFEDQMLRLMSRHKWLGRHDEMDFQRTHEFIAHGQIFRENHSIPATIVGSYPLFQPGYVQCKIIMKAEDWPLKNGSNAFGDLFDFQNPIQLSGTTDSGDDIWATKLRLRSLKRTSRQIIPSSDDQFVFKGVAEFFVGGDLDEFDTADARIICYISISPTRLAQTYSQYTPNTDGTISRYGKERKGIQWNTQLGNAELLDNYEYIETEEDVSLDTALARVQRCQITTKTQPLGIVSLKTILSDLNNILEESLLVLSLLSRRRIGWYEATAHLFVGEGSPINRPRATARSQQWLEYDNEANAYLTSTLPVEKSALVDSLFQQLLDNYIASPLKDTIRQTIQYLLIAYEKGYFEARLGIIYAALESLVDGLSKHHQMTYLMGSNKFKKLSQVLEQVIQKEAADVAEEVINKLPELRRPAIRERLLKLLQNYNLDQMRLRHSGTSISSELENILSRRNTYIHTGAVDVNQHSLDLYLLQELIELWLLRLLNCPDEVINSSAYSRILILASGMPDSFEAELADLLSQKD